MTAVPDKVRLLPPADGGQRTAGVPAVHEVFAVRARRRRQKPPHIVKCVSPFYYEGDVRQSLLRYKFGGVRAYYDIYAEFLVKTIDERAVSCDITWVPLSAKRLRKRGTIRHGSSPKRRQKLMGVECTVATKTRNIRAQSLTGGADERRKNVSGVYSPRDAELIKGRHVLIIDDIVTTGATLAECAGCLQNWERPPSAATLAEKSLV